ncbi:AzlD domain-containing protein [Neptunomonas marina]|nr:AzlD domain-containing protein [Neptunomonas marina]
MSDMTLWLLFAICGLLTFSIRLSFVQLHGHLAKHLERVQPVLALLPPAVLAALCIPPIVLNSHSAAVDWLQVMAGLVTLLLAVRFKSIIWPILGGMCVLWAGRYFL